MKSYYLTFIISFSTLFSMGQANNFPPTGNVGIGTVNAENKLAVLMDASTNGTGIAVQAVNSSGVGSQPGYAFLNPNGNRRIYNYLDVNSDSYNIGNANSLSLLTINQSGNVGIGTATPNAKLAVNGNIRAREVKVENANWPDYVFTKDYKYPSLQETEDHIITKGHLLGIPSAEEVKANGVNLGDMNAKLLQKVEELTLYLIEQNKVNVRQNKVIAEQSKRIKKLETKIK